MVYYPIAMKIYVGMSGGVDSSLTAALLKEQGHQVTGVYMKNWAEEWSIFDCPWADDLEDASKVAEQLGIPFKVFDLRQQYHDTVVSYMLAEYQAGRTPNPDVMCNQEMKFGVFMDLAFEDGAEAIATGHYARVKEGKLYAGLDTNKDQSYFLYRVRPEILTKVFMPIGEYKKPVVRQMAAERGLITAHKKDSQGICFIGKVDMKDFLRQYIQAEPGEVIDEHGKVVGYHQGAVFYTIGQRSGMGVGGGKPYYVTGKDMAKNQVFVTTDKEDKDLWAVTITIDQLHWLTEKPAAGQKYQVRPRYRSPLMSAEIAIEDERAQIKLDKPARAIAEGQSVVVYDGDLVVGGGIIVGSTSPDK